MLRLNAMESSPCLQSVPRMVLSNGLAGRENLTKGVQINITDEGIDIDLFIIVEYGISIVEVCKIIKSQVCYKIENMTGARVRRVNISVEGIRV